MKIRFLMHQVYGGGGGVLTVVRGLAEELGGRHEVELVSVLRTAEEPVHRLPAGVSVRALADVRPAAGSGPGQLLRRTALRSHSRLIPPDEPHYRHYSLYSDLQLARYLRSVRDGALVGMQPGVTLAVARFARSSVVRVGQDHRPFVVRKKLMEKHLRRHLPSLDMFLTLTETDARRYRQALGALPPVRAMPNATPDYTGTMSDHTQRVVTAAGHLTRDKGFDRLIDAWAIVHSRHPDWELRIYGKGKREHELAQQITALGLEGSVRLMGYSSSLMQAMVASSVFVLSSRVEGYGMVLVEAMSCGVPVVSFDCPTGPRDIITPGVDGLLVPNGDIVAMADAIGRLIERPAERREMGVAASRSARLRSQPAVAARWESMLTELASGKRAVT